MFHFANNKTFGARAREVLATVALMWFSMLLVVSFFKIVGLASVDFRTNIPLLGAGVNYWLQSHSLTLGQALTSPFVVMQLLIIMFGAPLLEEPLFRSLPCSVASDKKGNLRPRWGIFVIIVFPFILFGLAHGQGYFSVLVQGVGGLWLARLWYRNGPHVWVASFSTMAAHSLYNISWVIVTWLWAS